MKKMICFFAAAALAISVMATGVSAEIIGFNETFDKSPDYFAFEGDGFEVKEGAFVAKSIDKYNAAYFGEYVENCVFEFDYKDTGEGNHVGGVSLRVGSARYDLEISSDAIGNDDKVHIWKGGPNQVASCDPKVNAETGKKVPSIPVNTWVNFKVVLEGGHIRVYANDELCMDYQDSLPYTAGGFGIRAFQSRIAYDNMKIYAVSDLKLQSKTEENNTSVDGSTAGEKDESSAESTAGKNENPKTGDAGMMIMVLTALASGSGALVLRKKMR